MKKMDKLFNWISIASGAVGGFIVYSVKITIVRMLNPTDNS